MHSSHFNINLPHVIKISYVCYYSLQKLSQFLSFLFFFFFTFVKDADYFFIMTCIMLCNNEQNSSVKLHNCLSF